MRIQLTIFSSPARSARHLTRPCLNKPKMRQKQQTVQEPPPASPSILAAGPPATARRPRPPTSPKQPSYHRRCPDRPRALRTHIVNPPPLARSGPKSFAYWVCREKGGDHLRGAAYHWDKLGGEVKRAGREGDQDELVGTRTQTSTTRNISKRVVQPPPLPSILKTGATPCRRPFITSGLTQPAHPPQSSRCAAPFPVCLFTPSPVLYFSPPTLCGRRRTVLSTACTS